MRLGVDPYPRAFERTRHDRRAGKAHGGRTGEELEQADRPRADRRAHPGDPQLRQGQFSGHLRRRGADPGLHPSGFTARARLQDLPAARLRRFRRRRRAICSARKTNELTIRASSLQFLAKCFIPLPEKWHGLERRRDAVPPALPGSDRQPRVAPRVRGAQPRAGGHPRRSSTPAATSRSRRR